MPVNLALGQVSNGFIIAALVIYSLAVLAFAGDFAFGRPKRSAEVGRTQVRALATVGAPALGGHSPSRHIFSRHAFERFEGRLGREYWAVSAVIRNQLRRSRSV